MEVVQASEDVVASVNGFTLVDGAKMRIDWNAANGGVALNMACLAEVAGSGTLTVSMDGETVAAVREGSSTVTWRSSADSHVLEFSYSGGGTASVGSFENRNGLRIIIR